MKKAFFLFFMITSIFCFSQNDKAEIENVVNHFFTAMRNADGTTLKNTFSENVVFQTIDKNGIVKTEDAHKFAESISKYSKNDLDERFKIKKILTDGNLASVWMNYEFFFKGKVSHCGVNSFQLVKQNGIWKIQYIIDTRRKCEN